MFEKSHIHNWKRQMMMTTKMTIMNQTKIFPRRRRFVRFNTNASRPRRTKIANSNHTKMMVMSISWIQKKLQRRSSEESLMSFQGDVDSGSGLAPPIVAVSSFPGRTSDENHEICQREKKSYRCRFREETNTPKNIFLIETKNIFFLYRWKKKMMSISER